jgi:hypothetical protein
VPQDIGAGDALLRPCVHRLPDLRHGFDPPIALARGDRRVGPGSQEGMRRRDDRNIRMDVNQRLRRRRLSRKPKSQGRQVAEPRSDRNDQIRPLKETNVSWRRKEAKPPNPEPVIVWKLILHLEGGRDRYIPALAQRDQILAKFRSSTLSSHQQNRPLRLTNQRPSAPRRLDRDRRARRREPRRRADRPPSRERPAEARSPPARACRQAPRKMRAPIISGTWAAESILVDHLIRPLNVRPVSISCTASRFRFGVST